MPNFPFLSHINNNKCLVSDGATGTNLIARGLPTGLTSENWVIEHPEKIIQLHEDFIAAGADIILTSTFSGSSIRLEGNPLAGKLKEVNQTAVRLAKEASKNRDVYVAGSLGPVGKLIKPYGPLSVEDVQNAYTEQVHSISEAGADLLVIETQFDLGEIKAAALGARAASSLPLVVSLSYDRGKKTMMGVSPSQAAKVLNDLPVDMIGINCGKSLEDNLQNLLELRQATSKPIWFKPNAGLPHMNEQGITMYDTTPEMMGEQVKFWIDAGAQVIGGCCGTTPEHLRAIAGRVKSTGE